MPDRYARSERVDVSRVGQRAILYHRDRREALVLNPSGSRLWDQLHTPQTGEQLAASLQQQYGLSDEQASNDVDRFLADLRRHGALTE